MPVDYAQDHVRPNNEEWRSHVRAYKDNPLSWDRRTLGARPNHAGCRVPSAILAELGYPQVVTFEPKPNGHQEPLQGEGKRAEAKSRGWRDRVMTAACLQRLQFPPVSYVVPQLIPEGLSIIAGRPKVGKSWMALDVCIAVASGRFCLGERKPAQGNVLYCALEDNPRRLQRRIDKLLSPFSKSWPERLELVTSWRRIDQGGVDDIREWIGSVAEPKLVVLDTLAGVRPIRTNSGYTEDYESLASLHRLANEAGIGISVLHHTRKMDADDPLDTVSGTLGLAGCADTVLVLSRSSQGTTLYVRGRDIEEAEHAISFDKPSCRWTILGDASDVHRSNERGQILSALSGAIEALTPQNIVASTGMTRNNVDQLLFKMVRDGEVVKDGRGKYRCPDRAGLDPR
jgi:AAA domain